MDPLIEKALDQAYAERSNVLGQTAMHTAAGNQFAAEQMRLQHLRNNELMTAVAAQQLKKDGLAGEILQQRSARDQPGHVAA